MVGWEGCSAVVSGCGQWVWSVGVVSGCGQWVWSVGGGVTSLSHNVVSILILLPLQFF